MTARVASHMHRIPTTAYVARHIGDQVSTAQYANLMTIAQADFKNTGRVRITNEDIARLRGKAHDTVKRQTGILVRDGRYLQRAGWTFVVIGYAEHDVRCCGHGLCIVDATRLHVQALAIAASDELAAHRRKKDAERKRLARQQARSEAGF